MSGFNSLRAQLRRRLLVSYRVDAAIAQALIPDGFRPQLVDGSAVAGVCVIGLQAVRPGWIHRQIGFSTENVAHRVAVEWEEHGDIRTGVYIVERHSSSLLPVLAGGRLFPGVQRRGRFALDESDSRFRVRMTSRGTSVALDVELTPEWESSLFPSAEDASGFYRAGSVGWSPRRNGRGVEALELTSEQWSAEPGRVLSIESSFFDALPERAAVLDSVVVMRDLPLFWTLPRIVPEGQALAA
jgi:hypothetical protein